MKLSVSERRRKCFSALMDMQLSRCIHCARLFTCDREPTFDHIIPISIRRELTGSQRDCTMNVSLIKTRLACRLCNLERGTLRLLDYWKSANLLYSPHQHVRDYDVSVWLDQVRKDTLIIEDCLLCIMSRFSIGSFEYEAHMRRVVPLSLLPFQYMHGIDAVCEVNQ